MKTRPILFSTEMVKAILAGRKTQTRSRVKLEDRYWNYKSVCKDYKGTGFIFWTGKVSQEQSLQFYPNAEGKKCPYGQIGDVLWVRETWREVVDFDKTDFIAYKADFPFLVDKWNSPILMPKTAARIFLKITNIKVERLNDISESDAIKEGVEITGVNLNGIKPYKRYSKDHINDFYIHLPVTAKESYQTLWDSINGDGSWSLNPWVWVIEFERIDKPENL